MSRTKTPTTASTPMSSKPRTKRASKATTAAMSETGPTKKSTIVVTAEERHRMIAEAAYLRAERRGFANGDPQADWFAAEQEVDARIAAWKSNGGRQSAHN